MFKSKSTRFPTIFLLMITLFALSMNTFVTLAVAGTTTKQVTQNINLPKHVKNVILLIGDGMGPAQVGTAWYYSNQKLKKDLAMTKLMGEGSVGIMTTHSASAMVTDSAPAATAFSTGKKTNNGYVGVLPDGTPLETILEFVKKDGKATGLVTTTRITHATPADFASHTTNRDDENLIAAQMLDNGVDVMLGGGKSFFLSKDKGGKREDGRDLLSEAATKGYNVATNVAELKAIEELDTNKKVLGLFADSHMDYEIDRNVTVQPALSYMTIKALQYLDDRSPKGFFLMVEGGRIDHACHANDAAASIKDTIAFDKAVAEAISYAKADGETLVIVTADHETGGMGVIGYGKEQTPEYTGMNLSLIEKATGSSEKVFKEIKKALDPAKLNDTIEALKKDGAEVDPSNADAIELAVIRKIVKQYTSINLADDEVNFIKNGKMDINYTPDDRLGAVLRPYLQVGFSTGTHTATPVYLMAYGPYSDMVKGFKDNVDVYNIMMTAMGYKK